MTEPRHFQNKLVPIQLTEDGLLRALQILHNAIQTSVQILQQQGETSSEKDDMNDSLYVGNCGIALAFLRLSVQFEDAGLDAILGQKFQSQIASIISTLIPPLRTHHIKAGHLSPLHSVVGPATVYILTSLSFPSTAINRKLPPSQTSDDDDTWLTAIDTMERAIRKALEDDSLGGDEVLYGRAGLLWSILNIHQWLNGSIEISSSRRDALSRIANVTIIKDLVDEIIEAGDSGAHLFSKKAGTSDINLPLMWEWHGRHYLGAIHGVAGILAILLQAPREIITPHLHTVSSAVTALCVLTIQNSGHLPSSLPVKHHPYNLVQICHGSPGLLILLAVARARFPDIWREEWEEAEALAGKVVWDEGILKKGLGVCHGLAGNAWTLLLQSLVQKDPKDADKCLSRALAILVFSTQLPPLTQQEVPTPFRTPDRPFSLFEGLAGAVCAWTEACVIIQNRLRQMRSKDDTSEAKDMMNLILGVPGLGGARPGVRNSVPYFCMVADKMHVRVDIRKDARRKHISECFLKFNRLRAVKTDIPNPVLCTHLGIRSL